MTTTSARAVTDQASVILAPNPGPMTLDGTNSYLLAGVGATSSIVVDPEPDDAPHLPALAAAGPVELILITHPHHDHTEGGADRSRLTGASASPRNPSETARSSKQRGLSSPSSPLPGIPTTRCASYWRAPDRQVR